MGLFNRKEEKQSKILEEFRLLSIKIEQIEAKLEGYNQLVKNLRGLVNRKLGNEEPTENSIKDDGFNSVRRIGI